MFESNTNSISHSDKHSMLVYPNLINDNEDPHFSLFRDDSYIDDSIFLEALEELNEDFIEGDYHDDDYSEERFHYNLMNGKSFNQERKYESGSVDDIFTDTVKYPNNFQMQVSRILRRIEANNPEIFRFLRSKGIPYPVARRLVRKIIVLTLDYSKCKF